MDTMDSLSFSQHISRKSRPSTGVGYIYRCYKSPDRRQEIIEFVDSSSASQKTSDCFSPLDLLNSKVTISHTNKLKQPTISNHDSGRISNAVHTEHRNCRRRVCSVCKPKSKSKFNLKEDVEPVLFARWQVQTGRNDGVYLRKVNYKVNGLGQVVFSVDRSISGRVKENPEVLRTKVRVKLDTLRGQRVIARKDQDGLYYPASVLKFSDSRHASIKYDDSTVANILTRNLIPVGEAVARPTLVVGDYVLMRVVNLESNDECYVPAVIQIGPQNAEVQAKSYSVNMYNGQRASTLRTYLVNINKERFELASMYICDQQNEHEKTVDNTVYVSPRKTKGSDCEETNTESMKLTLSHFTQRRKQIQSAMNRYAYVSTRTSDERKQKKSYNTESYCLSEDEEKETFNDEKHPTKEKEKKAEEDNYDDEDFETEEVTEIISEGVTIDGNNKHGKTNKNYEDERNMENDDSKKDGGSPHNSVANDNQRLMLIRSPQSAMGRLKQKLLDQHKKQERQRKVPETFISPEHVLVKQSLYYDAGDKTPRLLHLRKSLQHVRPGEEVLARWSDDGWYYRGLVRHYHGDWSYNVEDSTGFIEQISREDIISENDNPNQVFEIDKKVIALHPDYNFRYAPGSVINVNDSEVEVKFYDRQKATLPWNEVYQSEPEKYQEDVRYICAKDNELVGAAIVARDDLTGAYYPASVKKKENNHREYVITWSYGTDQVQKAIHIFSAFTRRPPLTIGDNVLAMVDPVQAKFLPGKLTGAVRERLSVKFCDGEDRNDIEPALCYWLGREYYKEALKYFQNHDSTFCY